MKRIYLSFLAVIITLSAFSQAENAKYYIEGQYAAKSIKDTQGKSVYHYQLSYVSSQGIWFEQEQDTMIGEKMAEGYCKFIFKKAGTNYPNGFRDGLKFWRWDNDNNRWVPDSEVKDGEQVIDANKIATIILVLDCSSSLGDDFAKLKEGAKSFIDIICKKSDNGNMRIGIVGFNTMENTDNMIFPVEKLTGVTRNKMFSFIDGLQKANNTAFYYALRKANNMIEDYYQIIAPEIENGEKSYAGSYLVSFTDGYDNQSMDPELGDLDEGTDNPYFKFVRDSIINSKPIESFVISLMGEDIVVSKDKFEEILRSVSSKDIDNIHHFNQIEKISDLQKVFVDIAGKLIDRWSNLTCYIPPSGKGKVRWTIGENKKTKNISKNISGDFIIRPEIGLGTKWWGFQCELLGNFIYPLNSYFEVGGGIGLVRIGEQSYYDERKAGYTIPIFVNARAYCSKKKWKPFFATKIGYNIGLNTASARVNTNQTWNRIYYLHDYSGLFSELSFGLKYKNFNFEIAAQFITCKESSETDLSHVDQDGTSYTYDIWYHYYNSTICPLLFKFSYDIPIKKKRK